MKRINNWETFNELNRETYISAAKKLDDLGQNKTAERIRNHADNHNYNMFINARRKYHTDHVFQMIDGNDDTSSYMFLGTDFGMAYDNWRDSEKRTMTIAALFENVADDGNGVNAANDIENVIGFDFFISFDVDDSTYYVNAVDRNTGDDTELKFENRAEAKVFLPILKTTLIDELAEYKIKYPKDDMSEFEELALKICDVPIRQLY
jgi:hypothetical protein